MLAVAGEGLVGFEVSAEVEVEVEVEISFDSVAVLGFDVSFLELSISNAEVWTGREDCSGFFFGGTFDVFC